MLLQTWVICLSYSTFTPSSKLTPILPPLNQILTLLPPMPTRQPLAQPLFQPMMLVMTPTFPRPTRYLGQHRRGVPRRDHCRPGRQRGQPRLRSGGSWFDSITGIRPLRLDRIQDLSRLRALRDIFLDQRFALVVVRFGIVQTRFLVAFVVAIAF